MFSNNQSPDQRSQTPRPWNRYGPPNRFNAACHLISGYNDTSLLFVQHTPEAELLAWCSAAAPLWRNVCKLDMARKQYVRASHGTRRGLHVLNVQNNKGCLFRLITLINMKYWGCAKHWEEYMQIG